MQTELLFKNNYAYGDTIFLSCHLVPCTLIFQSDCFILFSVFRNYHEICVGKILKYSESVLKLMISKITCSHLSCARMSSSKINNSFSIKMLSCCMHVNLHDEDYMRNKNKLVGSCKYSAKILFKKSKPDVIQVRIEKKNPLKMSFNYF